MNGGSKHYLVETEDDGMKNPEDYQIRERPGMIRDYQSGGPVWDYQHADIMSEDFHHDGFKHDYQIDLDDKWLSKELYSPPGVGRGK